MWQKQERGGLVGAGLAAVWWGLEVRGVHTPGSGTSTLPPGWPLFTHLAARP